MITSLTGAILAHFGAVTLPAETNTGSITPADEAGVRLVHDAAQFCHCLAQGKIGSGFDVSSAAYGSHIYRRFSPSVLDGLLKKGEAAEEDAGAAVTTKDLGDVLGGSQWDNEVRRFGLPPQFTLMLADIDAGSSTPKLVSKVLAWRKEKPDEADSLWNELDSSNQRVEQLLTQLKETAVRRPQEYKDTLSRCSKVKAAEWSLLTAQEPSNTILRDLTDVYSHFQDIRRNLRKMSQLAGVPIEPEQQTRLLDACMEVPGVVMAGVPGAGGFDAIFCVALNEEAVAGVENVWIGWKEMAVGPLLARESSTGLVRLEKVPENMVHSFSA
ncbi:phosphomevalonate kinase [Borealophlyctis nickersoniae]|nr:phosphomevalonate kinase [Borealophlyctis nickersoniae]